MADTNAKSGNTEALAASTRKIENDLKELKSDLAALSKNIAGLGKAGAEDAVARAAHISDEFLQNSRKSLHDIRRQADRLEKQLEGTVRENPIQALLLAAGVGFLISFLARR